VRIELNLEHQGGRHKSSRPNFHKGEIKMTKILLLGFAVMMGSVVFADMLDFNEPSFQAAVRKTKGIAIVEKNVLQVFSAKPKQSGTAVIWPLPAPFRDIAGKRVRVSAEIALEDLSKPLKSWAGPNLMFEVRTEKGFNYYSFYSLKQECGTMDWTNVSKTIKMPDNIQYTRFVLGMQGQKGTVLFRNVEIKIE
jgi:hypothetical protein